MRLRHLVPAVATAVALTFTNMPAAKADTPSPEFTAMSQGWTVDQWSQFHALAEWSTATAGWTLTDWYQWGQLVDLGRFVDDVNAANAGDRDAVIRLVYVVWGDAAPWAIGIAQRESGLNPRAVNRSRPRDRDHACGLMQLLGHEDMFIAAGFGGQCLDALANLVVAHQLYLGSGRRPWAF